VVVKGVLFLEGHVNQFFTVVQVQVVQEDIVKIFLILQQAVCLFLLKAIQSQLVVVEVP
tara:strand:+ start:119 stop:295 length:177 start_codon:yes stop_codon:yes gene_type:complete